ncbi:hypothetical protein EYF80_063735 [Liparis tanakae]|uniref:Uncharacterized protein n=1 Tax=Liparis tanakae TaxID=230148 RepID=A0A4Z2EB68_9TELE|nr:hypothetical protein EYF80_063735 [Liparis tanakae]
MSAVVLAGGSEVERFLLEEGQSGSLHHHDVAIVHVVHLHLGGADDPVDHHPVEPHPSGRHAAGLARPDEALGEPVPLPHLGTVVASSGGSRGRHFIEGVALLAAAEADVEVSGRLHALHLDLHHLPGAAPRLRLEALTLQSVHRHRAAAMHLDGRVHLRDARRYARLGVKGMDESHLR